MEIIATVVGTLVTFVVGLLVGGLAIYLGAQLVVGKGDFGTAVWTALFGAVGSLIVSAVVSLLFGWIPILDGVIEFLLGLAVYLGIVAIQYNVDWVEAAAVSFVAWITVIVVRAVLGPLLGSNVVGVPLV